ncbi:MAG: alpha-glucosidase/alpha-galactosidase, partial [Planctomycetes bacterium]|nr:alpha-glucosidase/alpha-galactosidase [Planctomycetota bacterium]
MSKRTKIVFLGAGSAIFTERLVADLIRQKDVGDCHLVMHDIDKKVLGYMTAYTRMMVEREKSPIKIDGELSRARAFDGADFVLVTLTIGGGP